MTIRKHWRKLLIALCALVLLVLLCTTIPKSTARADSDDDMSSYTMSSYDITATLNTDCSMDVSELITMSYYSGRFTRTIPIEGKVRVKDARLYRVTEDENENPVYAEAKYGVTSDKEYVKIKSKTDRGTGTETYLVTYRLVNLPLTKKKSDDYVDIVNIGSGWSQNLSSNKVTMTLSLPDGFIAEKSTLYHGETESFESGTLVQCEDYMTDGNTIVYSPSTLRSGTGISFWLFFDKGVLSSGVADILPWLLLLIGLAIAACVIALRLTVFKDRETAVLKKICGSVKGVFAFRKNAGAANQSAADVPDAAGHAGITVPAAVAVPPDVPSTSLDPLTCRRVLECKVEDRDVVSLLFYWAEKGYIKFVTKSESNPVLVKNVDRLPDDCPESWRNMFASIFERTDRAAVKTVAKYIYPHFAEIRRETNRKRETSYSRKAIGIGCAFAVLAALFVSLLPVFVPMRMSSHAFSPIYFVTIIPALLIFAFYGAIYATRHRNSKAVTIIFTVIAFLYSAACVVLYCVYVPSGMFALGPKIIASILVLVTEAVAASFILRSDEYDEKLEEVNSVKNFILDTSRGDMEKIAEKDPYIYYEFLPYALLLRIGIPWSDKFRSMTLPVPFWIVTDEQRMRFADIRDTIKNTYDTILVQTVKSGTEKKKGR